MFRRLFAWMSKYERHLSAAAMVAGFAVDQIFFGRIDLPRTQALFLAYVGICVVAIALLHHIETRADHTGERPRWRGVLPLAIQFTLGGFWSGFVFFYSQSGALAASWPFLLLLAAILIGNEILKKYHDRLIFTAVLFFFALFSYSIFAVPVYTGQLGTGTFLASGATAVVFFALFLLLLYWLGRARLSSALRPILVGVAAVYLLINLFYFTSILPPLPLALTSAGIYHAVRHEGGVYTALAEPESWRVRFGLAPAIEHLAPGESLYAYSAVFAPIALTTTITHRWEWYDPANKAWVTKSAIAFPIEGGRDGGYRGYSAKAALAPGTWRVNIETIDGRLIGRVRFTIVPAALAPVESTKVLN